MGMSLVDENVYIMLKNPTDFIIDVVREVGWSFRASLILSATLCSVIFVCNQASLLYNFNLRVLRMRKGK